MSIDTSPEALANLRNWLLTPPEKMISGRLDYDETILALLDALEEARAKVTDAYVMLDAVRAEIERLNGERDMDVMMAENAALNEIPAAAPPVGSDAS